MNHQRYYRIADITIRVESDLPITDSTFSKTLELFRVDGPGADTVTVHHHFELPDLHELALGKEEYRKAPWTIHQQEDGWIYTWLLNQGNADVPIPWKVVTVNRDHTYAHIYHDHDEIYLEGNHKSLSLLPTDQIIIARLLADRQGSYLHSAGVIVNEVGMLFVGHSEAGKSTITRMLMDARAPSSSQFRVQILCDDRNIVRYRQNEWRVYGTWSHGEIPEVSPASAPLHAICFLEQAKENRLMPITNRQEIARRLLACVIKPLETADWWHKTLDLITKMIVEVPCYTMHFDKSGAIVEEIVSLTPAESSS